MYPSPRAPDLGVFVRDLERELLSFGHEVERAVLDTREGGKWRYLRLLRRTLAASRPDVVYAHFLVPTGLIAALTRRVPLVVTAHGQDVANVGTIPGVRAATRFVVRRSSTVIAVSGYLLSLLEKHVPEARGKTEVIDCGVDLERFRPLPRGEGADGAAFLCVGSLTERKNVLRLARAFERLRDGTLTFVGEGPLRPQLQGRVGIRLVGSVRHEEIPRYLAAADVLCQPSLVEPFGQSTLEALACGRSVVATGVGGPPEFVPEGAGVLVDPLDEEGLLQALRAAAALPTPNPVARAAAEEHGLTAQARRVEATLLRAARGPRA